jgi:hypothetical protein
MIKKILFLSGFIVLILFLSSFCGLYAEEMHPIWDYKNVIFFERPTGELGFRFRGESHKSSYDGGSGESRYGSFNEVLKIEDDMFILHPRFLKLNFGFGVGFEQGIADYESEGFLTDYKLRGEFLTGTPYSGSFFLEKTESDYEHTASSSYLMEMLRGGFNFRLGEEIIGWPINIRLGYSSKESDKTFSDYDYFIREEWKTFEIDTKKEWNMFEINLRSGVTQYERSYITDVSDRESDSLSVYVNGSLLGKFLDNHLRTKTFASVNSRSGYNEFLKLKYGQDVNYWVIKDKLQELDLFLKLNFETTDRKYGFDSEEDSILFQDKEELMETRMGVSHKLGISLYSELEGVLSKLSVSAYEEFLMGIRARTDYTKVIPWNGKLYGGYFFEFNNITRSGEETAYVKGELHTLSGYSPVALNYENVQSGSVEIFDASGEIHYVEGIDYRVYQAGPITYVERIPGTDIMNEESVFVDYSNENQLGNIVEFGHTVSLGVSLFNGLIEPYFRVFILNQEADGAVGSVEEHNDIFLNPGMSWTIGLRSRNTFEKLWNLERESNIEFESNEQELYPFQRITFKSTFSVPIPIIEGLKLSLSNNKTMIDYKTSDNDYEMLSSLFNAIYETRKLKTSFGAVCDISTIGDTDRRTFSFQGGLSYKLRRWTVDLFARQAFEGYETGGNSTESNGLLVKFYISRKF